MFSWLGGAALLVACNAKPSEPGECFPVPAGAHVLVLEPGMEAQGTQLQGALQGYLQAQGTRLQGAQPPDMPNQGTGLQGQDSAGFMSQQGTSLQGHDSATIMQSQGTSLQGRDSAGFMNQQGTSLQGHDSATIMQSQGTRLQGQDSATIMQSQGTSLQGQDAAPVMQLQGTRLQGRDSATILQSQGTRLQGEDSDIMEQQGTRLQGEDSAGLMQQQGTRLQGESTRVRGARPGDGGQRAHLAAAPGSYRGLGDLNGARLAIEADASNAVTLQDGQLVARGFADTASLRGTAIAALAPDGRQFRLEIGAVAVDGGTERVAIQVEGQPACQPGMQGVFVAGRWDAQAAHVEDAGLVTYSCMDGVIAKCVDWGYAPWLTDASVHAACTRMARADYCGNGTPWTLDGTVINIFDRLGIHTEASDSDMAFEAAWGPNGALCVARSRYAIEDASGRAVVPSCFATLPRCTGLDGDAAQPAVLANRSRVVPIEACK